MKSKNKLIEGAKCIVVFTHEGFLTNPITEEEKGWEKRINKRLNDYLHSKKFMREIYTDYGREITKFDL
jgi:hypothetical protein